MKKFTDEQIIKAMQCVIGNGVSCSECEYQKVLPFPSCRRMCAEQALDLINRKNAEIERLKRIIDEKDKEILGLQKRIISWREDLNYQPEKIKSEAINEFAERVETLVLPLLLAATLEEKDMVYRCLNIIDNLVTEMMEEKE